MPLAMEAPYAFSAPYIIIKEAMQKTLIQKATKDITKM
jgi:hypothetical protein